LRIGGERPLGDKAHVFPVAYGRVFAYRLGSKPSRQAQGGPCREDASYRQDVAQPQSLEVRQA